MLTYYYCPACKKTFGRDRGNLIMSICSKTKRIERVRKSRSKNPAARAAN